MIRPQRPSNGPNGGPLKLTKGSVASWSGLLDRYEELCGRMTPAEFCEREGVSLNAGPCLPGSPNRGAQTG